MSIVTTGSTTGESLTSLLLEVLNKHDLDVAAIVGQGYDGGSNMASAVKGVQGRVRQLNHNALFTHCSSHDLNRALINAVSTKANRRASDFFGTMELLYSFIEGSSQRHHIFVNVQLQRNPDKRPLHLTGKIFNGNELKFVSYS